MKFLNPKQHKTMNTINFMAYFNKHTTFLCFMPIEGVNNNWGVEIDGKHYCAVHIFNQPESKLKGDDPKEQRFIDQGLNYVVLFFGIDNSSYMKRFSTKEKAMKWVNNNDFFKVNHDCFFYNS